MSIDKPFHRTVRPMMPGPNRGYSGHAFITDEDYAKDPAHFVRAYLIIQKDLEEMFEYIEPSDEGATAFSYRLHGLFMRACIEVEANLRAILNENIFTPPVKGRVNMAHYKKVEQSHRLSSYTVILPSWYGGPKEFRPFAEWKSGGALQWYEDYHAAKHDRQESFRKANLVSTTTAVAGLAVLLASQFQTETFSASATVLGVSGHDYYPDEPTIGGLFRMRVPTNFLDAEKYDFDWAVLKKSPVRFQRFDYDAVP